MWTKNKTRLRIIGNHILLLPTAHDKFSVFKQKLRFLFNFFIFRTIYVDAVFNMFWHLHTLLQWKILIILRFAIDSLLKEKCGVIV